MELILYFIYLYVIIYTVYFLILAIRNLKDTPFHIERKYSKYDEETLSASKLQSLCSSWRL